MMAVQYRLAVGLYMCIVCVLLSEVSSDPCPCDDPRLCQPITTTPNKEVFIFSVINTYDVWLKYNWSLTTTVVVVGNFPAELMCVAHENAARIVPLVNFPVTVLTNAAVRKMWLNNTINMVKKHYFDGVNLDYEGQISSGQKTLRDAYSVLVKEITLSLKAFNPHAQISIDVPHGPNVYNRYYDFSLLADYSDFLVVMDYDEWGNSRIAGPNSPYPLTLQGFQAYMKLPYISASKLVLAAPWYGYDFTCLNLFPNNRCQGVSVEEGVELLELTEQRPQGYRNIHQQRTALPYGDIVNLLTNSTSGRLWDKASLSPYLNYKNSKDGELHQVWYDDPESLRIKYKLVSLLELRGGGMWRADTLDNSDTPQALAQRRDMWDTLTVFL